MEFDPNMMDPEELPPLWSALSNRDFEIAERLIKAGARLDDLIGKDGNTFLHDAAQNGDLEMVDFFLNQECPATLEQFDYISNTPLIRAAENGQTEVVARLLAARVNPNAHDEEQIGNTAIREAVRGGHAEIVWLLLRAGADPTIPGWMAMSAVDQAWNEEAKPNERMQKIRSLLAKYPSSLRDKCTKPKKNKRKKNKRKKSKR